MKIIKEDDDYFVKLAWPMQDDPCIGFLVFKDGRLIDTILNPGAVGVTLEKIDNQLHAYTVQPIRAHGACLTVL